MNKFKISVYILLFQIVAIFKLDAQNYNLTGKWSGYLTQPQEQSGLATEYPFSMNITQSGDSIFGTSRIEISKSPDFAVISLTGNVSRNFFFFQESEILEQNIKKSAFWCIKKGSLKYKSSTDELEGKWNSSSGCGPGIVYLKRIIENEQVNINISDSSENNNSSSIEIPVIDTIEEIEIVDNKIIVNNIYFDSGKYDLKESAKTELDKIYKFMTVNQQIKLFVSGHTDIIGDEVQLQDLSENRVKAVISYLTDKGIESGRISGKGYGCSKPLSSGDSETERAKNRRIEFEIIY